MSLGTVLLGVLADGPLHGYDLKREHDERFPAARPLAYGQVYATLTRLQRDGLVETFETRQEAGPERTVYAITDLGRDELARWLDETEQPGPYAADELVRKTITALHAGADSQRYLRRQRAVHLTAMRDLTQQRAAAAEVGTRIALDHTLAHLDADLRWLEETRERIAHDDGGPT
ncbi:PadR family transcriptional regulator [Nocardioides sp. URHA0020]|uniref:PadR family transcriptional regulator n=1 Tax=Nocardioides sp. URHA0020 TaxID=1380392 RepID=UPI000491DBEA|nr:PadR family transcriptional regulator [Nocardioides sp. URHA0020]